MTPAVLTLCAVLGAVQAPASAVPLTVSAAVSLSNALEDIGQAWARNGGRPVRFNFAASNALARQIVSGVRVDVFVSADEAQMDVVEKAGALAAGTRTPVVRNQLAVVAVPRLARVVRDGFTRAPPEIRRLAVGDPAAVPAGVYARQYLERIGAWKAYEPRLVPTASVRAALAAVESGGTDAAIVYVTDARIARGATLAFEVPLSEGPSIVYPAAVIATSAASADAQRFIAFLRGTEAQAIFAKHGFVPLAAR